MLLKFRFFGYFYICLLFGARIVDSRSIGLNPSRHNNPVRTLRWPEYTPLRGERRGHLKPTNLNLP